tara:strand:+ start:178 stop:633 length:456 start_codon:yes stop_codon:yes gene_type:complete
MEKVELDNFMEFLNKYYGENHKMTQIIKSKENDKKHTKWMLKEMEVHNSNLREFVNSYQNKSYSQSKYLYDYYQFIMKDIKRVRNESIEFMSDTEKVNFKKNVEKSDLIFNKKIESVLNQIKDPSTHHLSNKPSQGCLVLFIIPILIYFLI